MKCTQIVVLLVLATTYGSNGQTTPNNGMPIPATACGKQVMKCWNDQQAALDQADAIFDYAAGCKKYKAYIDCYNGVIKNTTCLKEPEVISINMEVTNERVELCLTEGQVTPCGALLQACMTDVMDIKNDYIKKNATAACPVIIKFQDCADKLRSSPVCSASDKVKNVLNEVAASLSEDDMVTGCTGSCGKLIGQCLGNLTDTMINGDLTSLDWKQFCRDAYAMLFCMSDLNNAAACTGDSLVQTVLESQHLVMRDYCAGNGKPAPCIQQVRTCSDNWKSNVGPKVATSVQCQAALDYQDCLTEVSCSADVKSTLTDISLAIESDEGKKHCPTLGTCSERLSICDSAKQDMSATNQTTEYCDLAKTAYFCFSLVRKDATCQRENINATKLESSLPATLKTICGITVGGEADHQRVSLLLIAAVVLFTGLISW